MTLLTPELLILLVIKADGGHLRGKTLLQKRGFFLCERFKCSVDYRAHYYGPYSPMLDATLGRLKSLGLIEEKSESFGRADGVGFEWRRYEFALTEDGRQVLTAFEQQEPDIVHAVREYLRQMEVAGDNGDYVKLSIAAKTFFVLKRREKPMTRDEIQGVAKRFGWSIEPEQIARAGEFLEQMRLTSKTTASFQH